MAEKSESFLDILNSYFSNLDDTQLPAGMKEKITIPLEWIFLEKSDRKDIIKRSTAEKALINLICKANKGYKSKIAWNRQEYGTISCFEIERTKDGVNLVINARDGWTKVVVTQDKSLRGPFYAIGEDGLYEEMLRAFDYESVGETCKEYNLSMDERESFIAKLKEPKIHEERKKDITTKLNNSARFLTQYYEHIAPKKTTSIVIQQRKGKGVKGAIRGDITPGRKSDIYDLGERGEILQQMNPCAVRNVNNIEDGEIISKLAYVVYAYRNPREKQGYLFVAEPFEGTHNTRMRFVTKEEYDKLQAREGEDKFDKIIKGFMEMSDEEFGDSKFCKKFRHTDIEGYRRRLRRIIQGAPMTNRSEEAHCAEIDRILFSGERRKTKIHIAKLASGTTASKVNEARGWLYARQKETQIVQ